MSYRHRRTDDLAPMQAIRNDGIQGKPKVFSLYHDRLLRATSYQHL